MDADDGLPLPQRYWAVLTIGLAVMMSVLDSAIANVALPTIARDLHTSAADSIWVVNAYQLAVVISLLPLSSLGDIIGYQKVYKTGLAVFTVASFVCTFSDSLTTLTLARVLQGFGAAGVMSVNTAMVRFIYPSSQLGRGMGINAMVVAVSSALGPTVASAILVAAPWQWLFAVNVPLGLIALVAARVLPTTVKSDRAFDWVSAIMNAVTIGAMVIGVDSISEPGRGWVTAVLLGIAAFMAVLLVRRQLSRPSPLLPVDLLRIPIFALSISTSICSFTAQMLAFVSLPFYLQETLGRSAVETGLLMTPWPLTIAVVALIAGRLADRCSVGVLCGIGLATFSLGLALLALLPDQPSALDIVWRMTICGMGFGLFQTPNNRAIIGSAPRSRSGGASGMLSTGRLLGQTAGAALVAIVFARFPAHGTTVTLVIASCFAAAAAAVSSVRLIEFGKQATARTKTP